MSKFDFIDCYFKGELSPEENRKFDEKIKEDAAFAEEVAFYCSALHLVKDHAAKERRKRFWMIYGESRYPAHKSKPAPVKKLWRYIAAAAVITGLIIGWYLFSKPPSLQRLADQYIQQNFEKGMGVKMAGTEDSIDAAIRLYNENKLPEALRQFEKIIQSGSKASLPGKMAGIVSLRTGDYDKAIKYFTQLENLSLYSNPGKLYHALALIKRNQSGDKEMVKQLLKQVIEMGLEGKETAQKWMESF